MNSRNRRRGRTPAWRTALVATRRALGSGCRWIVRNAREQIRPWRPAICLDDTGGDARRLRRALRNAARDYVRALDVPRPELVIVVQRVVMQDDAPLMSLLEVFEDAGGRQRDVVFLARSVAGHDIDDDELPALLRHQLELALAPSLGRLTFSAPLGLPRQTRATVVPLRGRDERAEDEGALADLDMLEDFAPVNDDERGPATERRTS